MQTNYDTSVDPDGNGELHLEETNPFHIPEITDHMFQFLELRDIKICRSVCLKWNQLAEKFLQKLSVVYISTPDRLDVFNQEFPNPQQSQIFTCFQFGKEWHNLGDFFEKWNDNLSEVTLHSKHFGPPHNENKTFDLSPLLPSTLTKLRIVSCNPKMIIATDKICNIRILELRNCVLNTIPGTILNPVEIKLEKVTFQEGEKNIEQLLINPLLNFDLLKKAKFGGKNIMLDLHGSHSLDTLSLGDGATVLNWETSNWEIKKLFFGFYTCKEKKEELSKSQIKYKELEICLQHLNVSLLPKGIEKLQVRLFNDEEVPPRISGQHNFPDLKHLHISLVGGVDFSPFVEFFKHCPKLTSLTVELFAARLISIDKSILKTSALPLSVQTLRVYGVRIIPDRSFQLESLILYDPQCGEQHNNMVDIAKELHVKNLIWFAINLVVGYEHSRDRFIFDYDKNKIINSLIDLNLDNFALGDFSEVELEKSYVFPLVDTEEKYYLLQRGKDVHWM